MTPELGRPDPAHDLTLASVTDDLASAEQLAELRGEELVWQTLLHQARAQLGTLAGYPHNRLCRAALDVAAEHIRCAEKILQGLDDVLDPKQSDPGRVLSIRHLQQRVDREQQALGRASCMTATAPTEQLDLFADLDATAEAVAETEHRQAFDRAPSIYGAAACGFFARVQAAAAWDEQHGHFDCLRRSHAWRDEVGGAGFGRGRIERRAVCRPTSLSADLRCEHYDHSCSCVGDLVYRGACLHCDWEGETRDDHNGAVEDAHDHAWPGWRDLPCVARRPEPGPSKKHSDAMQRWIDAVNDAYPEGWLESGGPILTVRGRVATRHVPAYSGFGGYDLCGTTEPEPVR